MADISPAAELAAILARCRAGDSVFMGGEHNPRPSEVRVAKQFVAALRAQIADEIRHATMPDDVPTYPLSWMSARSIVADFVARGAGGTE